MEVRTTLSSGVALVGEIAEPKAQIDGEAFLSWLGSRITEP